METVDFLIVFYDGDCGFCSHSIQTILKNRIHDQFKFVALQSPLAQNLLGKFSATITMETIYVVKNNCLYEKSNAILLISKELKMPYPLLRIGYIFPRFIRDGIYNIISKNRHKIMNNACILPTEEEKKLFQI